MNTAIVYSGAMRSFAKNWKNHAWFLWRHCLGAHFYCATHDDAEFDSSVNLPTGSIIAKLKQPEMVAPEGCPPRWVQGQHYMHEPYAISVAPSAVLGQLWCLREAWRLVEASGHTYQRIIRVRPDLWFHNMDPIHWADVEHRPAHAYSPWWGRFGGMNDRFAILGTHAAQNYFTTFDRVPTLIKDGAPLHPETLVHQALMSEGCIIEDGFGVQFSTTRVNGEIRPPEVFPDDVATRCAYLSFKRQ